ncbi:hypothetical protein ACFLXC_04145 [Chloroflexota bacterium]
MDKKGVYPALKPGDISGVRGKGIMPRLARRLFRPNTDLYHWFIIDYYIPDEGDYVIYESVAKGVTVGRLSFYQPEDLVIYRRRDVTPEQAKKAAAAVTRLGRARYDYCLYIKTFADVMRLVFSGKLPPWRAGDLRYSANSRYVCTEAAVWGWQQVGYPIVPPDVLPMGSSFLEAAEGGIIEQVYP